jgi:hypothetical protein
MVLFGEPIDKLALATARVVPLFLEKCFAFLLQENRLENEGIFRKSPSMDEQKHAIKMIDATGDLIMTPPPHHDLVASLIKKFIRDIPGHLLIDANWKAWSGIKTLPDVTRLIRSLPVVHQAILSRFLGFMSLLLNYPSNRMGVIAIGRMIAPNIIEGESETWLMPDETMTLMLQNYREIFGPLSAIDEEGNFLSEEAFRKIAGNVCDQFFVQSTPGPVTLKPHSEAKQCRMSRQFKIPDPSREALFGALLNIDCDYAIPPPALTTL